MADFFLSYKSEDRQRAELVARALAAEGLDIWWDRALSAGEDYQEVIDRNLREALVVVVLWSKLSVKSRWVRSEATIGDKYGALAPVQIEACDLPTAFVLVQTADLSNWQGDRADPAWRTLVSSLTAKRDQRRAQIAPQAAPALEPSDIEKLFWQSISDSDDPADFQSYMRRYPHGHFFDVAANRVRALQRHHAAPASLVATAPPPRLSKAPVFAIVGMALAAAIVAGGYFAFQSRLGASPADTRDQVQIQTAGRGDAPDAPIEVIRLPSGAAGGDLTGQTGPEEVAAWRRAAAENTPAGYRAYLDRYPRGDNSQRARARLLACANVESAAWQPFVGPTQRATGSNFDAPAPTEAEACRVAVEAAMNGRRNQCTTQSDGRLFRALEMVIVDPACSRCSSSADGWRCSSAVTYRCDGERADLSVSQSCPVAAD